MEKSKNNGLYIVLFSVFTRLGLLILIALFAFWTEYLNLKVGYNHPRLVELSQGKAMRIFYEMSDGFFSLFGDPLTVMKTNAGMTWSIRIMGFTFTDPINFLSVSLKGNPFSWGFAGGLIGPLLLLLIFNRAFCSFICPASLLFYCIARIRRFLNKFLLLPKIKIEGGFGWGVLLAGLICAYIFTHGVWSLILPYFAIGQTIFQGIAFGTISITVWAISFFVFVDLVCNEYFTCRNICPTGKLLGFLGKRSLYRVKKDESKCLTSCDSCNAICPFEAKPKQQSNENCSLCGECLVACPTGCLTIGKTNKKFDIKFES